MAADVSRYLQQAANYTKGLVREYGHLCGGVAQVRIFTRIFLAIFGLVRWAAVPKLPSADMAIALFST